LRGAVKVLAIINFAVFLATVASPRLLNLLALNLANFHVFQLVTSAFCHDTTGLSHLLTNLIGLWLFGSDLEQRLGSRRFVVFYLFCAIFANSAWLILMLSTVTTAPAGLFLGASGAVFGVFYGFAFFWPNAVVYLFFMYPIRVAHLLMFLGFVELWFTIFAWGAGGVAHGIHALGVVAAAVFLDVLYGGRVTTWFHRSRQEASFKLKTRHLTVIPGKLGQSDEHAEGDEDIARPSIVKSPFFRNENDDGDDQGPVIN